MTADCQILTGNPSSTGSHMSVLVFLRKIHFVHGLFFFLSWLLKYFWKRGIYSYKASILARIPKGYCITMSDPCLSGLLLWAVCYLKLLCTITLGHFLFFLPQFPDYLPCSVCLQPAPHDVDKVRPVGHLCLSWLSKVRWKKIIWICLAWE